MSEDPILIIPDIHEDAGFFRRCLSATLENRKVAEIILLGDLLDAKSQGARHPDSVRDTLSIARGLLQRQDPPTTLLWGNHDWKYWADRRELEGRVPPRVGDFDFFVSRDLAVSTVDALMKGGEAGGGNHFSIWREHAVLGVARRGWLLTHAGVHPSLWPRNAGLEEGIETLNRTMERLKREAGPDDPHPLLGAGPARGGFHEVGGPLWLDFVEEFVDGLPFPQLVGHTRNRDVIQKNRSYCIDVCQTVWALLHPDGNLELVS